MSIDPASGLGSAGRPAAGGPGSADRPESGGPGSADRPESGGPGSADRPEFSAGGVVLRGDDIVVIVPTKRGAGGVKVLGLPKGHAEPGETPAEAAAREVREEAGVSGDLIESLGTVEYTYERKGRRIVKRVEFFLFEYRDGDPADHDHEVEQARWMPLAEAVTALTYEGERDIAQRAMSHRSADR